MSSVTRRDALKLLVAASASASSACSETTAKPKAKKASEPEAPVAVADPVRRVSPLGFPWKTSDPFLFCAYHNDAYPRGTEQMGPDPSLLAGRRLGQDFQVRDGFRMYHGRIVPGFPRHPHRGFETVTVVRTGLLDHSDSMGAAARYGEGDVQWLTAGGGILHAEMFPLLKPDADNPLELFQIWLNLPAKRKMVEPHFSMLWKDTIPRHVVEDDAGRATELVVTTGSYQNEKTPAPPPASWASQPENDVAIWTLKMAPGAKFTLPAVSKRTERSLYIYRGSSLRVGSREVLANHRVELEGNGPVPLEGGMMETDLLLLQGQPIGEPIVKHGPFVMNTQQEIQRAYADYRATQFGGWPWNGDDPVHGREQARFARHANGRIERPA